MMKKLQKLGSSMMLPVACLPICGILMGLGYLLCPSTMQGGAVEGIVQMIGFFLVKAGASLIDNMAILFTIGIAVGLAKENNGTAGLAGMVSYLVITSLVNTGVISTLIPSLLPTHEIEKAIINDAGVAEIIKETVLNTATTNYIAFSKVAGNTFIGILAGIIGGACYNKFKDTKLPDVLAFFSGKRSVAIVTAVVSIVVSAVLLFVWPVIFGGLVALGNGITSLGAIGAGIYAFLNRLLIPVGLHHALNNVFWFGTIGINDLGKYWANEPGAGMYMAGFFPCMMFGIPGAALAIIQTAKTAKRKIAVGVVGSAAICAFICGVTEPFEFAFMFLAFPLYIVYSALYGIFTTITVALGFRAGFCFSAGATDLLFGAQMASANNYWVIIPMGIAAFVVFYFVFRFAITKFDLKTPGREDDAEGELNIELANNDFTKMAEIILEGVGGKANVTSIDNCITRLRLEVKDRLLVDEKVIKTSGAAGVIRPGKTSVQVIIGPKVQFVADEFKKLCK